ncbi:MAG: stage V sporulation protein AA [Eisenbergiella massiliensis]
MVCANKDILAHAKAMKIYKFRDTKPQRQVVSVMKIIDPFQKCILIDCGKWARRNHYGKVG